MSLNIGDRVVINSSTSYDGMEGVVAVANNGGNFNYGLTIDGYNTTRWFRSDEVTKIDEREGLVRAVEAAQLADSKAVTASREAQQAQHVTVRKLVDAREALKAYDEAHREPTFNDRVKSMGLGAVLAPRTWATKRKYVKVGDGKWQTISPETGHAYTYSDENFRTKDLWVILSEGVKA